MANEGYVIWGFFRKKSSHSTLSSELSEEGRHGYFDKPFPHARRYSEDTIIPSPILELLRESMPFLRGNLGFERFHVSGFESSQFSDEHIEILTQHAAGNIETASQENVHVGFLAGDHLFDQEFDHHKNVIGDALHCSVRIDTNKIPSAIKAAWMQMELAGLAKDNESGIPTKSQRKEAKEAVEQRCEVEAASGKYRKMQMFPFLWDLRSEQLLFGGSVGNASACCAGLLERVFGVEVSHYGAGSLAIDWACEVDRYAEIDDLEPASFTSVPIHGQHHWSNEYSKSPDFLGNEFLLWLWWTTQTNSDTFVLPDQTEATVMLTKTLALECPMNESGKEVITAECPIALPEALLAVRTGKLPRKTGMTVIRDGRQFDLVLQAERFGISGAKIHLDEDEEFDNEDRINAIRHLSETTDLMFHTFCDHRTSDGWQKMHREMVRWIESEQRFDQKAAA